MKKDLITLAAVLFAAMLTAVGCAQRRPQVQPEPAPAPAPSAPSAPAAPALPAPASAPAPATGANSGARSVEEYKRDFANHLHQTSAEQIFTGAPPHLLRSVIVMSVALDTSGNVVNARVLRDNGDPETVRSAVDSVRRGAPYPRPASRMFNRGRLEFTETWLFRDDGRFQLRTLAEAWQQ